MLDTLSFNIHKNDIDSDGRILQYLDTVHRVSILPVLKGKPLAGQTHFKNPTGIGTYNGFGSDGSFYTAGVLGRIWYAQESIDDFSDAVTDVDRWEGIVNDFQEGGVVPSLAYPSGLRLNCRYLGPLAEVYDRKGKMVFQNGISGNEAVISGRVKVPVSSVGVNLENGLLLCLQQQGSNDDYVFVGIVNTATYPRSVVQGDVVGGVFTVTSSLVLPVGTLEVDVAIKIDYVGSIYQGFYSLSPIGEDYTGASWSVVGGTQVLGAGWPSDCVPRIHAEFPSGYTVGEYKSLSDVRVEVGSGYFTGQQKASWWLANQDPNNTEVSGTQAECPNEVVIVWERDASGNAALSLIDATFPTTPKLWRRYKNIGICKDWDRVNENWSPGWMDADEGHIVLTRNTKGDLGVQGDERGEVWLFSLRWDRVLIFNVEGIGSFVSFYDASTGRILRESGNWGSLKTNTSQTYANILYDRYQVNAISGFVGTVRNGMLEVLSAALTYGVSIRRLSDNNIYVAYGVHEINTGIQYYAGILHLNENTHQAIQYARWICRKKSLFYAVWDQTDEAWLIVSLAYNMGLWWLQAGYSGPMDELEGALSRLDISSVVGFPNNVTTSPFEETLSWYATDIFSGRGFNINVMDTNIPTIQEIVTVASGWLGGSHLTLLWFNAVTPIATIVKTYGVSLPPETPSYFMDSIMPSNDFPRWLSIILPDSDAKLSRLRFTGSAGVGSDSFIPVSEGLWSCVGKFKGESLEGFSHKVARNIAIDRSDFTIEVEGRLIPPFAAGVGYQAHSLMSTSQIFTFMLELWGEKKTRGYIALVLKGGGGALGTINIQSGLSYYNMSGQQTFTQVVAAPALMSLPNALVLLRVSRIGNTWTFSFFNQDTLSWSTVMMQEGLRLPLISMLGVGLIDNFGFSCGVGVEINRVELAPLSFPIGTVFHRPVDYAIIPSTFGFFSGGVVSRQEIPTPTSGGFVVSQGWSFPGLMPRP